MMKHFKLLLFTGLLLAFSLAADASHVLGGELTFRCVGNGRYVFRVVLYKDCSGIPYGGTSLTVSNNVPGLANITCTLQGGPIDISPECTTTPGGPTAINCLGNPNGNSGSRGSVSRFVFESAPVSFNAIPAPPAGAPYIFYVSNVVCCRNGNLNSSCTSSTEWRCLMYRYEDPNTGLPVPPALLCDRSPEFSEPPTSLQIANASDTATFNNNAIDPDLDSLAYAIDMPWAQTNAPCPYRAGYSVTNPMPGIVFPAPGVPINPTTGELSFRPTTQGNWLLAIRVESWRCGQKISEVFRDFQLQVVVAPPNYPRPMTNISQQKRPRITKPFPDANGLPAQSFDACFFVGDTIEFEMSAFDFDFFPPQTIKLFYNSIAFSSDGSKAQAQANNCLYPPCAFLESPDPSKSAPQQISTITGNVLGFGYSGPGGIGAAFTWPTACSNLPDNGCGSRVSKYRFIVTAQDDQCPVNGKLIETIIVDLLPKPVLEAPVLHCVSVDGPSSISMNWSQEIDTSRHFKDSLASISIARRIASFNKYLIYRRDLPSAPFVLIDSVLDLNTTNYTDNSVNFGTSTEYTYRIVTVSGCFEQQSPPSNELQMIHLNLASTLSKSNLSWNMPSNPLVPTSTGTYDVQIDVAGAGFVSIGSTSSLSWLDTINVCGENADFRVGLLDGTGCISYSTIDGNFFRDTNYTAPVELDYVTVDTSTNEIELVWINAQDRDVVKYWPQYISNFTTTPPTFSILDTVFGYVNTNYLDNTLNPETGVYYFNVQGVDSCKNESNPDKPVHNNIRCIADINKCESTITTTWNNYNGWPAGVSSYELYRSINGGPDQLLYTSTSIDDTSFTEVVSTAGDNYCYTVIATNAADPTKQSFSNKNCILADVLQIPKFLYLRYASVDEATQNVNIAILIDTVADLKSFIIDRSINTPDNYVPYDTIPANMYQTITTMNGDYGQIIYTDNDVKTKRRSYYYRVRSVDVCDELNDTSNHARTIVLKGTADNDWYNRLDWNPYSDWFQGPGPNDRTGVGSYEVYRSIPIVSTTFQRLQNVGFNTSYADLVVGTRDDDGLFCYYVEALEFDANFNRFGLIDTARSNIVCVQQIPRMFFPNAFSPVGVNKLFIPKSTYVEKENFNLEIYNRWGDKVFQTSKLDEYWDGKILETENDAQMGVYVYTVRFTGTDGNVYDQKGTVLIIR